VDSLTNNRAISRLYIYNFCFRFSSRLLSAKMQLRQRKKPKDPSSPEGLHDPHPWMYSADGLDLLSPLVAKKISVPKDALNLFRWNEFKIGDIVGVRVNNGHEYAIIVAMWHHKNHGFESVVAWIYTQTQAKKVGITEWLINEKYIITNHFEVWNGRYFIPLLNSPRKDLVALANLNWNLGLNCSTKQFEALVDYGNDVLTAVRSEKSTQFVELPPELKDMIFGHLWDSVTKHPLHRHRHINLYDCHMKGNAVLDIPHFWSLRRVSTDLRTSVDRWLPTRLLLEQRFNIYARTFSNLDLEKLKQMWRWNDFTLSFRNITFVREWQHRDDFAIMAAFLLQYVRDLLPRLKSNCRITITFRCVEPSLFAKQHSELPMGTVENDLRALAQAAHQSGQHITVEFFGKASFSYDPRRLLLPRIMFVQLLQLYEEERAKLKAGTMDVDQA
jgi:hypothetical protein